MISPQELRPGLRRDIAISKIKLSEKEKHNGDRWPRYDSDFLDYLDRFREVIPSSYKVIDTLQKKTSPVVVDLMSSTAALASLFYDLPQDTKLGIAVGRSDPRDLREKTRDERLGISLIEGNIASANTWKALEKALNGQKADLIVECGGWGLDFIPASRDFHAAVARRAWNLLKSDNGLLLAQTRTAHELSEEGININKWVWQLNQLGIPSRRAEDGDERIATISLLKTPDSPKELPLLF